MRRDDEKSISMAVLTTSKILLFSVEFRCDFPGRIALISFISDFSDVLLVVEPLNSSSTAVGRGTVF